MTSAEILTLLARSQASPEHWAELVRRYGTRLWAVCHAAAGANLADDAFQNGLITIRRRAARFRPGADAESSALGWMVTVVHNAAIDLVRQERRRSRREGHLMPYEPRAAAPTEPDQEAATAQAMAALE
jgi:RNA polymerase sigma factor (sigma-70 family)